NEGAGDRLPKRVPARHGRVALFAKATQLWVNSNPNPLGAILSRALTWKWHSPTHQFRLAEVPRMAARRDVWYVRLPDGQELRAKTTKAVVHHIETGVIPKNSLVRRSHTDEWTVLEWTVEFADILAHRLARETGTNGSSTEKARPPTTATGLASRLDPLRRRTVRDCGP